MYGYNWLEKDNLFELSIEQKLQKELRPVFGEEIKLLGLDCFLKKVPADNEAPFLWAEGIRRYIIDGECVAEAQGGGFYSMPTIKVLTDKKFGVKPIDIEKLWNLNASLMDGLIQKSLAFIKQTYEEYSQKGYKFVVAFSGGKDSLVLLDLVQRALAPDQFIVVFGDTGMELSDTYQTLEKVRDLYPSLNFHVAKSILPANESWAKFGPPGRRLRWCCAIHKSVPTLLLLRKLTGKSHVKAVVFDGVRAEESLQRSTYIELSEGNKHTNQINCRPILDWNTAELYLYLLKRKILLNNAYRNGLFRVGCAVCPMSSAWWDGIANNIYKEDLAPLLKFVEEYALSCKPASEMKKYIEDGGWKARMGGNNLSFAHQKISESIANDAITFTISERTQDWLDVAPLMGAIVDRDNNQGTQVISKLAFNFSISEDGNRISYSPFSKMDRFAISWLRAVARKVAYCVGCQACEVECPTGAFQIDENRKIKIKTDSCIHCMNCVTEITKGCWAARALAITGGNDTMDLKGLDRYCHFGFRLEWLEHFFELKNDCWMSNQLGNKQYDSLRRWLKEAELIENNSGKGANNTTPLLDILAELGPYNPLTWAIIWIHLSYNSVLVRWYLFMVVPGESFEKNDLVMSIDDSLSLATRSNAIMSLTETFNSSPIGGSLEMGIPITVGKTKKYLKQGWSTPDPWALLYALYLYAEKIGNHYDFTLREMLSIGQEKKFDLPAVDPITIFALNPDNVKELFRDLSTQFPKYLKTSFVAGLDNIQLDPNISSLDVLKQAAQEA